MKKLVDPSAEMMRALELLAGVLRAQGIDVESLKGPDRPPPASVVPTYLPHPKWKEQENLSKKLGRGDS